MLMIMIKAILLSLIWVFGTVIYYIITEAQPTNTRMLIAAGPLLISVMSLLVTLVIIL